MEWGEAGRLWRAGLACGMRNAVQAATPYERVQAMRLLLCPVDSWRYIEFPAVLNAYRGQSPVLDVGSPKLLARILAARFGTAVHTADIVPMTGIECRVYQRGLRRGRISPIIASGCAIPAPDASYPFIYSVSVVEHIPGNGDTEAVRECARVLQPGGRLVITVPCVPEHRDIWQDADPFGKQIRGDDGRYFFGRWYDGETLMTRLVAPSGLEPASIRLFEERRPGWYARYRAATDVPRSIWSIGTKLADPWWMARNVVACSQGATGVAAHGLAVIHLVK